MRLMGALVAIAICSASFVADANPALEREPLPARFATDEANNCGWTMFSKYEAREVATLDKLPGGIRRKLQEHLTKRLGEAYYRRFSFFGGQIVDWPEFRRVEPNPGYKWRVFTYNLMLMLYAPEVGISSYCASIQLDAAGEVIEMRGFPPAARLPLKAKLIPLSHAYLIAKQNGLDPAKTTAALKYDPEIDSILYQLTQVFRGEYEGRDRIVDIDAHNGRLLSIRWESWQRHFN
jgi:hypothetical protein